MDSVGERPGSIPAAVEAAPVERVGASFVALYVAAYLGLWMALLAPILIGLTQRTQAIDAQHTSASLSLVHGLGALVALLANPVFGHLSDRTRMRLGSRKPWLIGGALGGLLGLVLVAQAQTMGQLVAGWCLAQLAFNAEVATLAALLSDHVPRQQRGTVAGFTSISVPVGMVMGTWLVQALSASVLASFLVPALIAVAGASALAWRLPRHDHLVTCSPRRDPAPWRQMFWLNPRRFPDFGWTWCSRLLMFSGVAVLMAYQGLYLIRQLGCSSAQLPQLVFLATLVQSATHTVIGVTGGWLSDRLGRAKPFIVTAALVYALALLVIATAGSYGTFLLGMALAGVGQGLYVAVTRSLAVSVLPERGQHAAKNLGIFNMADTLPQFLMPALASAILLMSAGNFTLLFLVAAATTIVSALAIRHVVGVR